MTSEDDVMPHAMGAQSEAHVDASEMSDDALGAELALVNAELVSLRRQLDEACRRGAVLADEQRRRLALGEDRDSVDLPSGSFRALYHRNG